MKRPKKISLAALKRMIKNLRDKPRSGPRELGDALGLKAVPDTDMAARNRANFERNMGKITKQIEEDEISAMLDEVEEDELFLQWLRRNGFDV